MEYKQTRLVLVERSCLEMSELSLLPLIFKNVDQIQSIDEFPDPSSLDAKQDIICTSVGGMKALRNFRSLGFAAFALRFRVFGGKRVIVAILDVGVHVDYPIYRRKRTFVRSGVLVS